MLFTWDLQDCGDCFGKLVNDWSYLVCDLKAIKKEEHNYFAQLSLVDEDLVAVISS